MITLKIINMAFCLLQICLIFTMLQQTTVMGFNLDLPTFIKHNGNPGSMFGFSVALYKSGGNGAPYASKWVIVGAPKDNNSLYQPSIIQPGAVWRCDIEGDDRCRVVAFDSQSNQVNDRYEQIDNKSNQWLGATIAASSDENGIIVACAPRYVFHTMNPSIRPSIEPVGTCFTSRNFSTFTEYSPCRTNYFGYHRQGYCQAGLSAGVSKKGDRLFIGAPGSWYWQGEAFSIDPDSKYPYKPPMYQDFGYGGQSYSYDIMHPKSKVYATTQGSANDDDSYLGYSTVTGDFDGDGEEDVALGMPRGSDLQGKISIYKWNMVNIFNITGWQIGAYFGYSMATCDVDGDGYDDLIIGAPMFSEPNNEGKYDVGRVYIMMQGKNPKEKFSKEEFRDGTNSKGRFGLSLTSLGDINLDGFGDFAVGAPYDGPNGNGAVYVFHGSEKGPLAKPSQIIYAEDVIGNIPPRTFGFSLSGGVDLDGNLYPDLAVGAYASDQVIVFRSRPVAVVDAKTTFMHPSKLIDLDERTCKTRDAKDVPCTNVNSCWRYTGINLPEILEFHVSLVLDARNIKNPRMFFLKTEGRNIRNSTIRLQRGKTFCQNETVYLTDNIRDKLTPLDVELRYQLRSNTAGRRNERIKREYLDPVIDQNREIVQKDTMNIQKNCGKDNICVPDLRLEIKTVNKYLLGSREPLQIEVLISNFGEDAFEAGFYMTMPENLDFKKIQQIGDARDAPITCTAPSQFTNYTLKCDIGNPLPAGKVANFKVVMIPSAKIGMASSYDFFMEANSTNHEKEGSGFDNIIRKSIGIWVETELAIEGTSIPEFGHYKASEFTSFKNATTENDLGPHVVHIYNIRNNGPSLIEEAVVYIHYPYKTQGDDVLMYLLNQPETDGNIVCDPHINVNPSNLQLDTDLAKKSYLVSIGAVIQNSTASSSHVEQSSASGFSAVATDIGTKILSEEEKRFLDEEQKRESSGDASFVHAQRAHEAAAAAAAAAAASSSSSSSYSSQSGGGGGGYSSSSSWNSSSSSSGGMHGPSVVVSSRNRTVSYDSDGRPHVVETSTEYVHNLNRQQGGAAGSSAQYSAGNRQWSNTDEDHRPHIEVNRQVASFGGLPSRESEQRSYQQQANQQSRQQFGQQGGQQQRQQFGAQQAGQQGGTGNYRTQYSNTYSPGEMTYNRQAAAGRGFDDLQGTTLDKFGAGQGFRTGTLDLGTLNRGNVDDQLRHRAGATYSSNAGQQQGGGSFGGSTFSQSSSSDPVYSQRYSSHREKPYYGTADVSEYYYDQDDNNDRGEYSSSSSSSSSGNFDSNRRTKRELPEGTISLSASAMCNSSKCATLRCVAKNLGNNEGVWVAIRTRLVAETMDRLASDVPLNVSTVAVSQVTKLPYIGMPTDEIIRSHEVFYKAIPEPIPTPDIIPLWIVILAACVGATILLLLVYLLHKCGFFHRNRPSDSSQERQPLRNGYHGDEHL
ncbi:integrin alpha-PS2 isoform X2 [Episyrphus balteatus]|uniref:integrin alpha-PS2 isoform X2 n=1 Tax=Episyrphus balteatus TaxID=286459 RepID=UPI002486315F|nr:integrin alpha-PS2 isoform X2 [Episyrphus balteatus]